MKKPKIALLLIAGPGVIAFEFVAIYIHLLTSINMKPWIIGGLIIFFVVFIPLFSVEYFKQNFKKSKENKSIQFRKGNRRIEWEGGNIHGKIPKEVERPGNFFKKE